MCKRTTKMEGRAASEKVDRREIVKKIAKSCRPLISEGRFRNHGADIMLMKYSSVAKSRIGTLSKSQVPVKCTDQKAQDLKKEGVCESQRRARAKRRA